MRSVCEGFDQTSYVTVQSGSNFYFPQDGTRKCRTSTLSDEDCEQIWRVPGAYPLLYISLCGRIVISLSINRIQTSKIHSRTYFETITDSPWVQSSTVSRTSVRLSTARAYETSYVPG